MANDFKIKLDLDFQSFLQNVEKAKQSANQFFNTVEGKKTKIEIDIDTQKASTEFDTLSKKIKSEKVVITPDLDTSNVEKKSSGISGIFGGALLGGAVAGLAANLVGSLTEGVGKLVDLSLQADEIGDNMQLAFSQAGLSGEALAKEIERADKFGFKLGQTLAVSPTEIKKLSISVASLSGATGKANEDLTKLAIGIEKASGGAVSGEQAIKVFSRGVADPENAEAIDKLIKKFPALGDAIRSSGDVAGKTNAALLALAPTFKTLEEQAGGADAVFQRLSDAGLEGALKFAGGIIDGLGEAGKKIAQASGGFEFDKIFDTLKEAGTAVGELIGDVVIKAIDLFNKFKPALEVVGAIVGGVIVVAFNFLKESISAAFERIEAFGEIILEVLNPLTSLFGEASIGAVDFKEVISEISIAFRNFFGIATELIQLALVPVTLILRELVQVGVNVVKFFVELFTSTKDVANVAKEGDERFQGFNGTLLKIRATISGVVESAKTIKDVFFQAFNAVLSLDFKGALNAFAGLGEKTKQSFEKGFNDTVKKETDKQKADREQAIEEELAKEKEKREKSRKEKENKAKEHQKTLLQLAQEALAAEESTSKGNVTRITNAKEELAVTQKRKLSEQEIAEINQKKVEEANRLVTEYEKIFKITKDSAGNITTGIKGISKKDEASVIAGYEEKIKQSIEARKAQINLAPPKPENINDLIKEIETLSKNKEVAIDSNFDFSGAISKGLDVLNDKQNALKLQLTGETNTDTINSINKQIADIEKAKGDIVKNAEKTNFEASIQIRRNNLLLIQNEEQKALQTKLIDLDIAQQRELETLGLTQEQKLAIEKQYAEKRKALFVTENNALENLVRDFSDSLNNAFVGFSFVSDDSVQEAKDKLSEVNKEYEKNKKALDKQLKDGELSYNDYTSRIADLDKERVENSKDANEKIAKENDVTQKILDRFNIAGAKTFKKIEEDKRTELKQSTKNYLESINDQNKTDTDRKGLVKQVYTDMAGVVGSQLGQILLSGANGAEAIKNLALDTLDSLIPVLTAQIFGISMASPANIASLGTWGVIQFGLITATLKGLVALARGAEDGGLITPNYSKPKGATDTIPMWLAPNEFVVKSSMATKYRAILEQINAGTYKFGTSEVIPIPSVESVFKTPQITNYGNYDFNRLETKLEAVEIAINEGKLRSVPIEMKEAKFKLNGNDMVAIVNQRQIRSVRRS